ncbi:MAG: biotin-dependent carboxyltransferase [Deltaproteobacteria bacterium]|nr:biotin-dependent carboxyltransferase [Deltaproteobacteria bacterium]
MAIRILGPGPLSTVQDSGRFGYQDHGVPVSGAMDLHAYRVANLLAGNRDVEACIEIAWGGFRAEFLAPARIAVTGADTKPGLNGRPFPCWSGIEAQKGDILEIKSPETGCRTYLALSGGVDVPEVMGSRSTYVRGGFGGHEGRALRKGDVFGLGQGGGAPISACPPALIPKYCDHPVLRVVLGPQAQALTPESLCRFFSSPYVVTDRCDRMGCSLKGPVLVHRNKADIVSDGTVFGAIQVPGNGQPIILMADRQTIGGYAKPATVISVDLPLLAQLVPGASVRFEAVSLWAARELAVTTEYRFQKWITHEKSR